MFILGDLLVWEGGFVGRTLFCYQMNHEQKKNLKKDGRVNEYKDLHGLVGVACTCDRGN